MHQFTENSTLLAIESSCDETSAALYQGGALKSNIISSQMFHTKFGGIVPELASRAHVQHIGAVVREALNEAGLAMQDVDAIAVTQAPGLAGSLVVGTNFAKGLALRYNLPIVAVNHVEGHIYSAFIENTAIAFPFLALIVSGGHTSLFFVESFERYTAVGSTRDDAAGEAFDKIAKLLGLGYPGGIHIDRLAKEGRADAVAFPRSMMRDDNFDFSFSGLKTAVRTYCQKTLAAPPNEQQLRDICASAQEAIVDVLVHKTLKAAENLGAKDIVVAGGVAANSRLRVRLQEAAAETGRSVFIPAMSYCTDNAAMIGCIGREKLLRGVQSPLTFTIGVGSLRARYR
ncbi:MAG: tRNA (adenosine(37)-N6)-threonylcarbamoyltransferase complex transferase subunit TsaD [Candidatus Kapabacteria bacterium]|jgi:N6-L-threonylcarbamoyladenine synthase|nr:tRNA (adenosine(37)-N6)-threonylcarbamoyltransferase complex transferase subunit TsaD [Candidatus Kapabacteria bacterium]